MKYCMEYAALLDLYADGELAAEEMARVQAHLDECPGCQAYVDDALTIRAGFPGIEDVEVPEGFTEGVMERVRADAEAERAKRKTRRRWLGALVPLAACCALVILLQNGSGMSGGGNFMPEAADMDLMDGEAQTAAGASAGCDTGASEDSSLEVSTEAPEAAEPRAKMDSDMEAPKAADCEYAKDDANSDLPMEAADGAVEESGEYDYRNTVTGVQPSIAAQAPAASPKGDAQELAPEPAAGFDREREAVLTLTAEEAGEFLENWVLEEDRGGSRWYRITAEQYQKLIAALAMNDASVEAKETAALADGTMLVEVTGPF